MAAILAPTGAHAITASLPPANLRTGAQTLATRLLRCSVRDIAHAIDKDESTASRVRASERAITVSEFCELLDLVGLKLVSRDKKCVSPERLRFLEQTTSRVLASEEASALLFDGEEPE